MSTFTTKRRHPDTYRITQNKLMPRSLRLATAAELANRLIRTAQELFDSRREAPCAECRLWEHYDLTVDIAHLTQPVGTLPSEWQDHITQLVDQHETGTHHSIMWREVFLRDAYEYAPVEFECEIKGCATSKQTMQRHMFRCIEHDLIMCPRHWNEHDRKEHGRQACEHLRARISEVQTTRQARGNSRGR